MKTENYIHIGGHKKIALSDIIMLKAFINYTNVYLNDGQIILSSTTIGVFEKRLKDFHFFRTHRSVIINLQFIKNLEDKNQIVNFYKINIKNKAGEPFNIPLSRRRTAEFLKLIQ